MSTFTNNNIYTWDSKAHKKNANQEWNILPILPLACDLCIGKLKKNVPEALLTSMKEVYSTNKWAVSQLENG